MNFRFSDVRGATSLKRLSSMHTCSLLLACLVCTGHGRQRSRSLRKHLGINTSAQDQSGPLQAFAQLLRATYFADAFKPSRPGRAHVSNAFNYIVSLRSPAILMTEMRRDVDGKPYAEWEFFEKYGPDESAFEEMWNSAEPAGDLMTIDEITVGEEMHGTVRGFSFDGAILNIGIRGRAVLSTTQMSSERECAPDEHLVEGQEVTARVLRIERKKDTHYSKGETREDLVFFTLVGDRRTPAAVVRNPGGAPVSSFQVGQVVEGTVTQTSRFNAYINIGAERVAIVKKDNTNDGFIAHCADAVKPGEEVVGRILSIDEQQAIIELSLLEEDVDPQKDLHTKQFGQDADPAESTKEDANEDKAESGKDDPEAGPGLS